MFLGTAWLLGMHAYNYALTNFAKKFTILLFYGMHAHGSAYYSNYHSHMCKPQFEAAGGGIFE